VLLDETVGWVRWLGIALMAVGLVVVGVSANIGPAEPQSARVLE